MSEEYMQSFSITYLGNKEVIKIDDVLVFNSKDKYTDIYTKQGSRVYLTEETLKSFERGIDPRIFVRTQRGVIVNINYVDRILPEKKSVNGNMRYYKFIIMKGLDRKFPISRRLVRPLKERLTKFFEA